MKLLDCVKKDRRILYSGLLILLFIISFISFLFSFSGKRYYFEFDVAGTKETVVEVRRIISQKGRNSLQVYVDELILGPSVQRGVPVFPTGTKVLFCIKQDKKVMINLSKDALYNITDSDIERIESADNPKKTTVMNERYLNFVKNIRHNFPEIKEVELFIEGNFVSGNR